MLNEKTLKCYAHTDPENPGKSPEYKENWPLYREHLVSKTKMYFGYDSNWNNKKTAGYGLHMLRLSPVGGACEFLLL